MGDYHVNHDVTKYGYWHAHDNAERSLSASVMCSKMSYITHTICNSW